MLSAGQARQAAVNMNTAHVPTVASSRLTESSGISLHGGGVGEGYGVGVVSFILFRSDIPVSLFESIHVDVLNNSSV